MTERLATEYMTELQDLYSECDSIEDLRVFSRDSLEKAEYETALFASYCFQQEHPNEQFYCTNSELEVDAFRYSDISWDCASEEEDKYEELPTKQAFEVAAAARFISKVEVVTLNSRIDTGIRGVTKLRLGSTTSVRNSILDGSLNLSKYRPHNMQAAFASKRSKPTVPPPLILSQAQSGPEEIQSPLPTRSSSKGAPSFDIARPPDSAKHFLHSMTSPSLMSEPRTPLSILTPETANNFQFDFCFPTEMRDDTEAKPAADADAEIEAGPETGTEPSLSRSGSGATTDSQTPQTPPFGPSDDQMRRDIEAFVLEQGPFLRGSQRRPRKPPTSSAHDNEETEESMLHPILEHNQARATTITADAGKDTEALEQDEGVIGQPHLRRKKSIFGWLQKRPEKPEVEVDDLIDLYMTDEQRRDVRMVKRKPSRAKLIVFRNRVTIDPLPVKPS